MSSWARDLQQPLLARVAGGWWVVAPGCVATIAGCGNSADTSHRTLRVPASYQTVQRAVAAAKPGDLVLLAPGTYHEAVEVRTPRIVIRGLDRNRVILDGRYRLDDGIHVTADGVAVENLTVRRYLSNGVLFDGANKPGDESAPVFDKPLNGYRASYVTTSSNGLYGLYAFAARNGVFDHAYASGHADSGIYIGQCKPCNAVVRDTLAESNALGFEGTNASGGVYLINSTWRDNRVGMTVNTQNRERLAPQEGVVIAGNLVDNNDNPRTPETEGAFGDGIDIGGGQRNLVTRNRVVNNRSIGIAVTDLAGFTPASNRVVDNAALDNGIDLAFYFSRRATADGARNCFEGNDFRTSLPARIEVRLPCGTKARGPAPAREPPRSTAPRAISFRDVAPSPPQPVMPNPTRAARPAVGLPPHVTLDDIRLPPAP